MSSKEYFKAYYRRNREKHIARGKLRYALHKQEKHEYDKKRRLLQGEALRQYDRYRYAHTRRFLIQNRMIQSARARAKKRNIPFSLQLEDIVIPEFCPVLGIRLNVNSGSGGADDSPSLDRIIPALGYIKGNVAVISKKANTIKHCASAKEIHAVARWVAKLTGCVLE